MKDRPTQTTGVAGTLRRPRLSGNTAAVLALLILCCACYAADKPEPSAEPAPAADEKALELLASPPQFSGTLDRESVPANGTVTLAVTATWKGHPVAYHLNPPKLAGLKNLTVVNSCQGNTTDPTDNTFRRTFTYTLRPEKEAPAETGRIVITYLKPGQKGPFEGSVRSIKLDVLPAESHLLLYVLVGAGVLGTGVIAAAVILIAVLRRKARKKARPGGAAIERVYLDRLNDASRLRLEGDVKRYFAEVSNIVCEYLREARNMPAGGADDAAEWVRENVAEPHGPKLYQALRRSAKVRFAGETPSPRDLDRFESVARDFLEDMLPKQQKQRPEDVIKLR